MTALPPRPDYQLKIGQWIVNAEARRDVKGRICVYKLPKADGGGTYEVAGINDRYDGRMAEHLANLIRLNQQQQAEIEARDYILSNTDIVMPWVHNVAIEAYLRDCCFNRGPGGAAKILQIALGSPVKVDGYVGPVTLKAAAGIMNAKNFLLSLRRAREAYERVIAPPVGARAVFWPGLVNRWDNSLAFAQSLL